jgi:uncharacterized membrane protein YfcA
MLDAMLLLRGRRTKPESDHVDPDLSSSALLTVGLIAGVSSGFLGIGGGLATVVGLSAVLGVPQHQAQMISLVLSLVPTTLPSAWVYWSSGALTRWPVLLAVIPGLAIGTDLGARLANRISPMALRRLTIGFVSAMAIYMAFKAQH